MEYVENFKNSDTKSNLKTAKRLHQTLYWGRFRHGKWAHGRLNIISQCKLKPWCGCTRHLWARLRHIAHQGPGEAAHGVATLVDELAVWHEVKQTLSLWTSNTHKCFPKTNKTCPDNIYVTSCKNQEQIIVARIRDWREPLSTGPAAGTPRGQRAPRYPGCGGRCRTQWLIKV